MTNQQIEFAAKLNDLKKKIINCTDQETISLLVKAAVQKAQQMPPVDGDLSNEYFEKMKSMIITSLSEEEDKISNGIYQNIDNARFSIIASIVMLMLNCTGASLEELDEYFK